MKIENLSKTLDAQTLSTVRGGDNGNSAANTIGQQLNLSVPVGVLAGGPSNTNVSVDTKQTGNIWNEQIGGDTFVTGLLPSCCRAS
jgi:hypothetical protein